MDEATKKNQMTTYDVTCGDDTKGNISSRSPDEARDSAEEMCRVHNGVQSGPEARPWKGHRQ